MNIVILGATSVIAQETAKYLASPQNKFFLVARHADKLNIVASDLKVRGSESHTLDSDLADVQKHEFIFNESLKALGSIDVVYIAYGVLPNQEECEKSLELELSSLHTNFNSTVSLIHYYAAYFKSKKSGTIAVISSVAGDRGRQSNYSYGASKAALNAYLEGLRNRLYIQGVHVLTIKPGPVDTPLIEGIHPTPFLAPASEVGQKIAKAILGNKDVLYVPGIWRYIMCIIRHIPEFIFKRLKL